MRARRQGEELPAVDRQEGGPLIHTVSGAQPNAVRRLRSARGGPRERRRHAGTLSVDGGGAAVVPGGGRHEPDLRVTAIVVVPVKERATEAASVGD